MLGSTLLPPKPCLKSLRIDSQSPHYNFKVTADARVKAPSTTLYQVMRINETASQPEIKAAYRALAKIYHPDIATSSQSQANTHHFIQIQTAYSILSDPNARALYDLSLAASPPRHFASKRPRKRWETDQCW